MTDHTSPESDEQAARLAQLRARRAANGGASPRVDRSGASTGAAADRQDRWSPPGATGPSPGERPAASRSPRRRSPALGAKMLTAGASATAVLAIVAGFGIADRASADDGTAAGPDPSSTATPATSPPQVIVVVVDGTTGQPVAAPADLAIDVEEIVSTTLVPVEAPPSTVDLAVPAPAQVRDVAPAAESSGS